MSFPSEPTLKDYKKYRRKVEAEILGIVLGLVEEGKWAIRDEAVVIEKGEAVVIEDRLGGTLVLPLRRVHLLRGRE